MNCLILVALLLCCGGNGCGSSNWLGGCFGSNSCGNGCGNSCNNGCGSSRGNDCGNRNDGCGRSEGGRRERNDDDCGCRSDFRQDSRFEQRPFLFNQSSDCGCEESQNKGCDCDR